MLVLPSFTPFSPKQTEQTFQNTNMIVSLLAQNLPVTPLCLQETAPINKQGMWSLERLRNLFKVIQAVNNIRLESRLWISTFWPLNHYAIPRVKG